MWNELAEDAKEIRYFDLPEESLPLFVRRRDDGDRIMLPGMTKSKRLSRLFIDEKVNKQMRDRLPVIVTAQGEVCAVPGLRYGDVITTKRRERYIFILANHLRNLR